jgi:hypothetical protein
MSATGLSEIDLMPPPFCEGLHDWSRGDGTPESETYGDLEFATARVAQDEDFGACLELRKTEVVQRLRYMGEMPYRPGSYVEVSARVKALRGPRGLMRIAALPGGRMGRPLHELQSTGAIVGLDIYNRTYEAVAVFGPEPRPGVDAVWGDRVLYAHVGLDIIGPNGGIVRIESIQARDVTREITGLPRIRPGFQVSDLPSRSLGR